ncbi:MAG: DUF4364 family protein [Clostridia bacterium]|nr:DUF4364 family protein [Clostridia bacterium]
MIRDAFDAGVEPGGLHSRHEIKILICYMLSGVCEPMPREAVPEILCEHGMANFFDVAAAMDELIGLNNLSETEDGLVTVTDTGRQAAATLETLVPYTLRQRSVAAAVRLLARRRNEKENHVTIDATDSGYTVTCTIGDLEHPMLTTSLLVGDELQAKLIRDRFLDDPLLLYRSTVAVLSGEADITTDKKQIVIDLT